MLLNNLGSILLFVTNLQASSLFYQELLKVKPFYESLINVAFKLNNGVQLVLWSRYAVEPHVEMLPGSQEICFRVEDADAHFEYWSKKPVTIAQKITDMEFVRTFLILDPDGYKLRIYHCCQEY